MEFIYIIRTMSVNENSEDDLRKEYEIFKIKYDTWHSKTFDEFLKFQKSWKDDKYSIHTDDLVYCESYEIAYDKVINNCCDMNDGGLYNYVAILKVKTNYCYASVCAASEDVILFQYDIDSRKYIELRDNTTEISLFKDKAIGVIRG
jgi:hypothetical protein